MKVTLGRFACACLEEVTAQTPPTAVHRALRHYETALAGDQKPPDYPRPWVLPRADGGVEMEIDDDFATLIDRESRRQAVSASELIDHLVFVYVAYLDTAPLGPADHGREEVRPPSVRGKRAVDRIDRDAEPSATRPDDERGCPPGAGRVATRARDR